jgi:hypothetical protein
MTGSGTPLPEVWVQRYAEVPFSPILEVLNPPEVMPFDLPMIKLFDKVGQITSST